MLQKRLNYLLLFHIKTMSQIEDESEIKPETIPPWEYAKDIKIIIS